MTCCLCDKKLEPGEERKAFAFSKNVYCINCWMRPIQNSWFNTLVGRGRDLPEEEKEHIKLEKR